MQKHFTATVYLFHEGKTLLIEHPKFNKWLPPGGHVEENESPVDTAIREVKEETGLEIELLSDENIFISEKNATTMQRPYLCLIENIPENKNEKKHQHIDFIYIAKPRGLSKQSHKELLQSLLQNSKKKPPYKWFTFEEVLSIPENDIFPDTKKVIAHILKQDITEKLSP